MMEQISGPIRMVSTCLLGMEGPVASELKAFGAQNVAAQDGRVFSRGDTAMLARANLLLSVWERILVVLGQFPARTFDELFEGVKALPWERWLIKGCVSSKRTQPPFKKLFSVPDCQKIIKKAIVERLREKYSMSWFEESGAEASGPVLFIEGYGDADAGHLWRRTA